MTAFEKEQIFVELRKYHLDEFPTKLSSSKMDGVLVEFRELEDKIVSMLFGLVNGKTEYVDMGDDLKAFTKKVKIMPTGDRSEDEDRNLFLSKLSLLSQILNVAASGTFKLRPPRKARVIRSENPRKVTEKQTKAAA